MTVDIRPFGKTTDGREVQRVCLRAGELTVVVLTWGAVLNDVRLAGAPHSLTLGTDVMAGYEARMVHFGSIVGPVANRIGGASAVIGGKRYDFEVNEAVGKTLHGGINGTQRRIWAIAEASRSSVTLTLDLADGDGGFPGNRQLTARFDLSAPAALTLTLEARSDAETIVNLANHSYWNLDGSMTYAGHRFRVAADSYTPCDAQNLPTGEAAPVAGTFDLRNGRILNGTEVYDTNFCLATTPRPLSFAAELTGKSGVRMVLETTEPGLQVYDGRGINTAPYPGHAGVPYAPHAGLALEAQRWPDATNHANFPSIVLSPGEQYQQVTRFTFDRV
ncbi:MAG: galactose mutarotase [Paracoccaceae bacterium]|nr:galactose mutarotase [Paracoccaceae bacterium]